MATKVSVVSLILLFSRITECHGEMKPSGVCFVPTKLSEAAEPLSNPLISPSTPRDQHQDMKTYMASL